jgi:phosphotriesterase-related protein
MDRFGLYGILDNEARVRTVAELCARGHASRLVLSHDASCVNDWFPPGTPFSEEWQYCHISRDVIPALLDAGVTEADITTMLVDNPRRVFDVSGSY